MDFLEWLMPATEKFPKRARFSFSQRIDNLALDVADTLDARKSFFKGLAVDPMFMHLFHREPSHLWQFLVAASKSFI
jgi:hypothetical protein